MPMVKINTHLSNLQDVCITSICKNMDNFWCKDFLERYFNMSHWRYVLGPFDAISPDLCQKILKQLKENGLLKKHHFYLLLSIYSKIVDFSHCDIDINLIIQLIQERCYMLQQLNLSHCVKLPKASFNMLLSHCGKGLTKLELSHSNIANDVLSTISVYCSELSYLDISKTNSISDPGLLCLAHEQDLDAKANSRFGKCLKLVVLKLNGCEKISEQAVASVIVNLPKLRVLEYQDSISAIALARNYKADLNVTLTSLHSSAELIDETDVCEVLLANCKSLQSLNLTTFMELSEATAFSILEIDNLKELSLVNEFGSNAVSFQLTFSPILTKLGPNLTHLTLSQVCDISVGNIRQHCTKLETLSLIWNTHYIDDNSQDQMYPYFQCLKNVKVFSTDSDSNGMDDGFSNVSYLDILSIISSPKLEEIHMLSCQNFIGETIENASVYTKFSNLRKLRLERCNRINYAGLKPILEEVNPLEEVMLLDCREISIKNSNAFQKLAKKKKWNVTFEWS